MVAVVLLSQNPWTQLAMRPEDPDDLPRALLKSLGTLYGATVACVVLANSEGQLSLLTYSSIDQELLRDQFAAWAVTPWSTAKSR